MIIEAQDISEIINALAAIDDGDTLVFPENETLNVENLQLNISNKSNVTIDFNGSTIVETGIGNRPVGYFAAENCPGLVLNGPKVDMGGSVSSGTNLGYGLYILNCDNVIINNPEISNTNWDTETYCVYVGFSNFAKINGGLMKNGKRGIVRFQSCDTAEIEDSELVYDNGLSPSTNAGRFVNFETTAGTLDATSWKIKNIVCTATEDMPPNQCGINFNPVNNVGSVLFAEIDGLVMSNPNFDSSLGNNYPIKIEDGHQINYKNMTYTDVPCLEALRARNMYNGAVVNVENCEFHRGNITVSGKSINHVCSLNIKNTKFLNTDNPEGAILISGSTRFIIDVDSDTEFRELGGNSGSTRYFFNSNVNYSHADSCNFDCSIYCGSGSGLKCIFRRSSRLGNMRLGPNFKVYPGGGTTILAFDLGLAVPGGSRLAVTDDRGHGRLNMLLNQWLDGAEGRHEIWPNISTTTNRHQVVNGKPAGVFATEGDIIINTTLVNGLEQFWVYTSGSWRTPPNELFRPFEVVEWEALDKSGNIVHIGSTPIGNITRSGQKKIKRLN